MKSQIIRALLTLGVVGLVSFVSHGVASGSYDHRGEIVGTWSVTVQLNNCSGAPLGPPFQSLLTFEEGRTMIEDTTNPSFAPGQRGTGHGVWRYEGHGTYSAKSVAFINYTTTPPPPPGFTSGTQIILQTIDFNNDPDQWTSDAQVEFADASGTVYRHACASASGQRLE